MEDGYEFFAKRQLVTLFSAPNYCGEFDNAGAMMSVDETLMCSFQILKVITLIFKSKVIFKVSLTNEIQLLGFRILNVLLNFQSEF